MKKAIGGGKNGKEREVPEVKAPKWYPADDIKAKVPSEREAHSRGVAKLKKTIKPGSVLILLGGRFRGKRVVFLKQLSSGLLLVTGPYQLNGVPLRRVNQAYCISTSASVDVKGADVSKIDDAFFARTKKPKSKKDGEEFFGDADEVRPASPAPLQPRPPPVGGRADRSARMGRWARGAAEPPQERGGPQAGHGGGPCGGRLRLLVVGPGWAMCGGWALCGGLSPARRKRGWQCRAQQCAVQQCRAAVPCGGLGSAAHAGTGGSETQAAAQP